MNGFIFGVNVVPEWEDKDKLYVFIDKKDVWEDREDFTGYIPDRLAEELKKIGIVNDSETVFSQPENLYMGGGKYKDNIIMTREQIINELTVLGFEYNVDFENDCVNLSYP